MRTGLVLGLLGVTGCFSQTLRRDTNTVVVREVANELEREPVPGTVNDVYIEPMVDQVRVPGRLDPHHTYYRLPHRTLVEIRHERFQKVEYPDEDINGYPRHD